MDKLKNYFDQMNDFLLANKQTAIYVAYALIFICAAFLSVAIVLYFKNSHIIGILFTRITGNIEKRDELRKKNITAEIKRKKTQIYDIEDDSEKKKSRIKSIIDDNKKKFNSLIFYSGLLNIPGFSTTTMLVLLGIIEFFVFVIASLTRGISLGITLSVIILMFFFYGLSLIKYQRRTKLEGQLLQLINDVTSASLQYQNIIDIFGAIYENYTEPLKGALEYCYVEAKRTRNQALAMEHLKDKFDSMQFNFIIDNFILCSRTTANYTEVATNLSDTVTIYHTSFEKKKAIVKNAKVELTIMFFLIFVIIFAMGVFVSNLYSVLLDTTFGNIIIAILVAIYLYGINVKGERS